MDAHFSTLMDQLDDIKDSIPEGKYIEFCNALRDAKRLSDQSVLYKITYVDAAIVMNQATISVITPRVVRKTINPYEFFSGCSAEYVQAKIAKLRETIAVHGFAKSHQGGCDAAYEDTTAISVYWEDDDLAEPIHVRLDRNRDIVIISLEPLSGKRLVTSPDITMHMGLFRRMAAHIREGTWEVVTDPDNVTSVRDSSGRPQTAMRDDGTLVQIVYPAEEDGSNLLTT